MIAGIMQLRPDLLAIARELDPERKSAAFNDAKMRTPTGEPTPHHGIIPSTPENPVNSADWSEAERNVYDMVVELILPSSLPITDIARCCCALAFKLARSSVQRVSAQPIKVGRLCTKSLRRWTVRLPRKKGQRVNFLT